VRSAEGRPLVFRIHGGTGNGGSSLGFQRLPGATLIRFVVIQTTERTEVGGHPPVLLVDGEQTRFRDLVCETGVCEVGVRSGGGGCGDGRRQMLNRGWENFRDQGVTEQHESTV